MIIGVLKEIKPNEYRVAAIPATVKELVTHGHQALVHQKAILRTAAGGKIHIRLLTQ